jgi:hypothetical protein
MSLLATAKAGAEIGPQMNVMVGLPGVGKTTFAAEFPHALILDLEGGSKHINTTRIEPSNLDSIDKLNSVIDELIATKHGYKTIVLDSYTELEKLLKAKVCAENNVSIIEEIEFGKGVVKLEAAHDALMLKLKQLQKTGVDVNVITHTQIKGFTDPRLNSTYDTFGIQSHKSLAPKLISIADNVFFCTYQVDTSIDKKTKKTQAFGDGSRVMYTEWRPGHVGKNRLNLPYEMPMSYAALAEAIKANKPKSVAELKASIENGLLQASTKLSAPQLEKAKQAAKEAGDDPASLERVLTKLNTINNA